MSEPVDLDGIEARANAATPGPWSQSSQYGRVDVFQHPYTPGDEMVAELVDAYDAEHIAGMDPATTLALVAEVRALRRWKDEALPVMSGLQEVGGALGLGLGELITGRGAVDAALDLHNEVRSLRAKVEAVGALHVGGYRSSSDEAWGRNAICTGCESSWPCGTVSALAAERVS